MYTSKNKMRVPVYILAIFALVSIALAGCGQNSPASIVQTVAPFCSQKAVIAAEKYTSFLNSAEATVAIPQGEPQIVATVNEQSITAKQLEMTVQNTLYTNQITLANAGPDMPQDLKALLTLLPDKVRQMRLTSLIDNNLWLALGQHNGEETSVATAQQQLRHSIDTFHKFSSNDSARFQFEAFLCANHLTEASYSTNPRIVQQLRDSITAATAKRHEQSLLASTQQSSDVQTNLNTYIQSLWSKNNVKVFLAGFVPLRSDGQIQ